MKLSILIATIGRRGAKFTRLLDVLKPQLTDEIEVIAYWNNGELPINKIRQALVEEATGEYICFIDDDDLVPEYYCDEILANLGEDYVGFRVRLYENEVERIPVYHSLRYREWSQDDTAYYRGVTHLNPIKREIALQGNWGNLTTGGEDGHWANSIKDLAQTEKYIDRVMYFYYHSTDDTSFGASHTHTQYRRPKVDIKGFRYHPDSREEVIHEITKCRSCGLHNLVTIFDLGDQYVSDFRDDESKPSKYPLTALICEDCKLVQLQHTTPSQEMYHENYGFKSGISNSIKADLKEVTEVALSHRPDAKNWLDIASNDGTLLSFVPKTIRRVGVDPIKKLCDEAEQHANLIVNDFFRAADFYEYFDIITSISCFYDMDDPNKFVSEVVSVMKPDAIWVIQQNYLLPTLQLNAIDNFCHEHLEYYTLLSLEPLLDRHGLEVIDLSTSMVNGGSLRTVVARKGYYETTKMVRMQRRLEKDYGLDTLKPYERFAKDALNEVRSLKALVDSINSRGQTVYILAASTRGATIWQAAGLTEKDIPFAVERNPAKVGKYFSAIGCKIISEEEARDNNPDYMLIGPWFFADEIIERESHYSSEGGKLIIPLPKVRLV